MTSIVGLDLVERYRQANATLDNLYTCGDVDEGTATATLAFLAINEEIEKALALAAAASALAALDPHMWLDTATSFTCTEAEVIADFLRALDLAGTAKGFIRAHAEGDVDEEDLHYSPEIQVTKEGQHLMSTATSEPKGQDFEIRYSEVVYWYVEITAQDEAEAWEIWRDKKFDLHEEAVSTDSEGYRDVTLERAEGVS